MGAHSRDVPGRRRWVRLGGVAAGVLALGLVTGPALAAPPEGKGPKVTPPGHLILTVDGEEITAGPGKALRLAFAECEDRDNVDATVTVDTVRAAFPEPVEVCDGVTLTSQVAADEDEVEAA